MMRWTRRATITSALLGFVGSTASVNAQPEPIRLGELFRSAEPAVPAGLLSAADSATALRQRLVLLDHDVLATARLNAEALVVVQLNLFADVSLAAVVDRTGPTSAGYWLAGSIEGQELGSLTLVANGDVIAGTVRTPGAIYAIRSLGGDVHVVREVDPAQLPRRESGGALRPSASLTGTESANRTRPIRPPLARATPAPPPEEDGARIDVLVVYTPAARDAAGGRDAIEALVDLFVAETNQAYADSGVIQRINLARTAQEADYVERPPGSDEESEIMRHLLDPSDGYLDEVHPLRDRLAADLVQLIASDVGFPYCGEAKPLQPSDNDRAMRYAFGITRHDCGGIVFAHELGHAMGLNHDRYAARHDCCIVRHSREWNKPYPYSYGYVNQRAFEPGASASSRWITIMSYGTQCYDAGFDCQHLLRFSNPDVTYNGDPMGVPGTRPSSRVNGPSDARRTLNRTRRIVADFRRAPCLRDGARIRLQASNGQYVVALNGGGGEVQAARERPSRWGRLYLVDANGGCVESGDTVSVRTSDGFYLRAVGGGGSSLDATAPRPTPWARFKLHRRRPSGRRSALTLSGPVRSGDFIALQAPSGHYVWAEQGGGGALRADRGGSARLWGTFKTCCAR